MAFAPLSPRTALGYVDRMGLWRDSLFDAKAIRLRVRQGRNSIFVLQAANDALALKQARDGNCSDRLIAKEARILGALPPGIGCGLRHWDPIEGVMALEFIEPADPPIGLTEQGHRLAKQLANLHDQPPPATDQAVRPFLTDPRFWDEVERASPLFAELANKETDLRERCCRVADQLTKDAFIHGDAKTLNAVFCNEGRATLIDFELGGAGEALWDVASLLVDVLGATLLAAKDKNDFDAKEQSGIEAMQSTLMAYGVERVAPQSRKLGMLVALAAISFAFSLLQDAARIDKTALALMQLGQNGIANPEALWEGLRAA